jgi:hypothetical protein
MPQAGDQHQHSQKRDLVIQLFAHEITVAAILCKYSRQGHLSTLLDQIKGNPLTVFSRSNEFGAA